MANYKIPNETIQAAQALLASADHLNYHQVHEVVLREIDGNADPENCQTVHLIPIGGVLGVVTSKVGATYEDKDIVFVSIQALGSALYALGFKTRLYNIGVELIPPTNPQLKTEE
jgi:hypothetical protein